MIHDIFGFNSSEWVFFEHFLEEIKGIIGDSEVLGAFQLYGTGPVLGKNFVIGFSIEWAFSHEKNVENET